MNFFYNFFKLKSKQVFYFISLILVSTTILSAQSRIHYANKDIFMNGSNVAWVNFAHDIGPGNTNFARFQEIFSEMHADGGNSFRLWLHTDGTNTPEFDSNGLVVGPGTGAISDLKKILDLAWQNNVGLLLCLWSHDMMNTSKSSTVLDRNEKLLTDTSAIRAYINNALIPMVDSVKGHPAIIAWEIFNEPEGFTEIGNWGTTRHVSEYDVQRFVNLTAGAIHRADPGAKVTNGTWGLTAQTDVPSPAASLKKTFYNSLTDNQKLEMENEWEVKYGFHLSAQELIDKYYSSATGNTNFYRDDRLINAGGDSLGTLDFYTVHYYSWAGSSLSPFQHPYSTWNLTKPLVIAEFYVVNTYNVAWQNLYAQLYNTGYAGALSWQWLGDTPENDNAKNNDHTRTISNLQDIWTNHQSSVEISIAPSVTITSPENNSIFPDSSEVLISADVTDSVRNIVRVEFYANDTLMIGEKDTLPYSITWKNIPSGNYDIEAIAVDDEGYLWPSKTISIGVGDAAINKLEAEYAILQGSPTKMTDATASNGSYVTMQQAGSITWIVSNVPKDGDYGMVFRYRLSFGTPKSQLIYVNGDSVAEVTFTSEAIKWLDKSLTINLKQGIDTIKMVLYWGWMDLDYMGVPVGIVTSVEKNSQKLKTFSLSQNYPNPFNPSTNFQFTIEKEGAVNLSIYNILGQRVATLIDKNYSPGTYTYRFDGSNLSSGMYIYVLNSGGLTLSKKMILLK